MARTHLVGRSSGSADAHAERARYLWSAGDYDRISTGFRHEAEAFVKRAHINGAHRVLDAACGSGNVAIPAARAGANVCACDIVPEFLDLGTAWAAREKLIVRFDHASVERMPYEEAQFDVVLSMFGIMFAARPDCVMHELQRITRPGGRVVLASWTPESFAGRVLAAHARYLPPAQGVPSPLAWGVEETVRSRFDPGQWELVVRVREATLRYPHTAAGTAELFRAAFGPTVRAMELLDEDRRAQFAAELRDLWAEHDAPSSAQTIVASEYLEVSAFRR